MSTRLDGWGWLLLVFGVASLANGLWGMFAAPHWYANVAADTGPFNQHFVRDIGEAYGTVGGALIWAAFAPAWRGPLCGVAAMFLGLHAVGHVYEIAMGELDAHHWIEDLPGVFLPGALFVWLTFRFLRAPEES